jgi:glycerophosphoryl diester phosphodiesterase
MIHLAHRGLWKSIEEKNGAAALLLALQSGFGLETDIRDARGHLVVSHDPPEGHVLLLEEALGFRGSKDKSLPLALNIKADGLSGRLRQLLEKTDVKEYFCFDMSVPETLVYRREGLRFFTRESEYEPHPPLYDNAAGVWMDMFHSDWITPAQIVRHLEAGKQVAIVSPELHGRPHESFWARLRDAGLARRSGVMLCTDFPLTAREFFYE